MCIFCYLTNPLHTEMAVITSQIMEDTRYFDFINLKSEVIWWADLLCDSGLLLWYLSVCMIYRKCDILWLA